VCVWVYVRLREEKTARVMRIKIRLHAESVREISFCPPSSLADSKKNSRESGERERAERESREREIF
jgi:hypothetical protein